jgi:energy-coupling factor transporter ATP-binding protein EcfA2
MVSSRRETTSGETERLAQVSTNAPRIPWDVFCRKVFQWKLDEHVALIGPTGLGKTTLLLNILPLHPYVVVFATKPRDRTMNALIEHGGYTRIERWTSMDADQFPCRVLWPDASQLDSDRLQKEVFHDAFQKIYREGHWTVALDELWYIDNVLGLERDIKMYLLQARSLGISLVAAFQRPAWVPKDIYSSCTHVMFWRTNDEDDVKTIGGIGSLSAHLIRYMVSTLDPFQVLYINTRTGAMARTRCPNVQLQLAPKGGTK